MIDLTGLNQAQHEAVTTTEGPLLILAGAGSGKTRVLTCRVAYLVDDLGVDPESVLAITFTNKATREMKHRIAALLGPLASRVRVGTFHRVCLELLRAHADRVGLKTNFGIAGPGDSDRIVRELCKGTDQDPDKIRGAISRAKNNMQTPEDLREKRGFGALADNYELYEAELKKVEAIDLDDILLICYRLLNDCPDILAHYQELFRYIHVDEYQDTNRVQYLIASMLAQKHRNFMVVGDDDQAIYAFRGADVRNILDFESEYPDAKVLNLSINYRSTPNIVAVADAIIRRNRTRREKEVETPNAPGAPVYYYAATSERDEAAFVVRVMQQYLAKKVVRADGIAILYRLSSLSVEFEQALLRAGIRYEVVKGTRYVDRKIIRDAMAYLHLTVRPQDDLSLRRIANVPKRGLGEASVKQLSEIADKHFTSMSEAAELVATGQAQVPDRMLAGVKSLAEALRGGRDAAASGRPLAAVVRAVLDASGLTDLDSETMSQDEVADVYKLADVASSLSQENPGAGITELLDFLSLQSEADEEDGTGKVKLLTVHAAKGLEFDLVFVVGLEDQVFPHHRALADLDPTKLEEERRLMYVAVTRAAQRLVLSSAISRRMFGSTKSNPPCRFLRDVPPQLITKLKTGSRS